MKKIITLIIGFVMMLSLVSCSSKTKNTTLSADDTPSTTIPSDTTPTDDDEIINKTLTIKINN